MRSSLSCGVLTLLILCSIQPHILNSYVIDNGNSVRIVAVNILPNGSYVGVVAELNARVTCPGAGHIFVETLPLSQLDLQASTRVAAIVASRLVGVDFMSCDFFVSIKAESPIVGGPSASAVTSLVFAASLLGLKVSDEVIMTGMIMPDGSVGPVGGLKVKLEAAARVGAKKFLIPYGQTYDVDYVTVEERRGNVVIYRTQQVVVDLIDYGRRLGVEVIPVANIYEALEILTNGRFKAPGIHDSLNVLSKLELMTNPIFAEWVRDIKNEVVKYVNEGNSAKGEVLKTLSGSNLMYVRNLLNSIESSLNDTLRRANELEDQQLLYAASSAYFQAFTYAKWRYHLLKTLLNSSYLTSEARRIESSTMALIDEVHDLVGDRVDLGMVNVLANVLERAYDALMYLNNSLNSQEISKSTYYLGLADARMHTARLWLKLSERSLTGKLISAGDLDNMVINIESLVQNIYAYILALSDTAATQSDIFNEAYTRYVLMQSLSNNLEKFAVGLGSLGYMYLTLFSMFTNNYSASAEALNRTITMTLSILNTAAPIDAIAYLELAKAYTSDPQYQTYMLARLSMLLSTYLSLKYVGSSAPSTTPTAAPPQCQVTVTRTITVTNTVTLTTTLERESLTGVVSGAQDFTTSLLALLLVLLMAILLFGVRTSKK